MIYNIIIYSKIIHGKIGRFQAPRQASFFRVCMFTTMLLYTVTITNRASGCTYTTIQAAANAANEDE